MRCYLVLLTSCWMVFLAIFFGVAGTNSASSANTTSTRFSKARNRTYAWLSMNWRRSKFPIIRPTLRLKTKVISRTPVTAINFTNVEVTTVEPVVVVSGNDTAAKQDLFELSSSDNSRSVAWPVPRRPTPRRLWSNVTPRSTSVPIPKLLLPRPTRPAMYSLDGFVPKPSIIRITTTEAPDHIKRKYSEVFSKDSLGKRQYGRQSTSSTQKESTTKRIDRRKVVNRFTAFARRGVPGQDYPIHNSIPNTNFDCSTKPGPGMYADPETGCQIWHICPGVIPHRYSFMCPNGTVFNEGRAVCDWWYNVACSKDFRKT